MNMQQGIYIFTSFFAFQRQAMGKKCVCVCVCVCVYERERERERESVQ